MKQLKPIPVGEAVFSWEFVSIDPEEFELVGKTEANGVVIFLRFGYISRRLISFFSVVAKIVLSESSSYSIPMRFQKPFHNVFEAAIQAVEMIHPKNELKVSESSINTRNTIFRFFYGRDMRFGVVYGRRGWRGQHKGFEPMYQFQLEHDDAYEWICEKTGIVSHLAFSNDHKKEDVIDFFQRLEKVEKGDFSSVKMFQENEKIFIHFSCFWLDVAFKHVLDIGPEPKLFVEKNHQQIFQLATSVDKSNRFLAIELAKTFSS